MRAGQFGRVSRSSISGTRVAALQRILPSVYARGDGDVQSVLAPNLIRHFHDSSQLSLSKVHRKTAPRASWNAGKPALG